MKKLTTLPWFWLVLCCAFIVQAVFTLAFAFDVAPLPVGLPTSDQEVLKIIEAIWQFIVEKKYGAAIGPAVMVFVWGLKKWDLKIFTFLKLPAAGAAVDKFLDQPFVSFLLPTVVAGIGGFANALITGHSFVDALSSIWAASTTAITTYVGLKKVEEQWAAGEKAAVAVDTKAEAVEALKTAAADESKKAG